MFTPDERTRLRGELLEHAARDPRILSGAITGSAAEGREDRWSDIDLAFAIDSDTLQVVLSDWTSLMYKRHTAVHQLDVLHGEWTYRVFLLSSGLQVDLAFVRSEDFRALAPSFQLVFGACAEPQHAQPPESQGLVGWGWLYAVHARACIARRKLWQAEYMISGVRDTALALACLRHGLPTAHGRGYDRLPADVASRFEAGLVGRLDLVEVQRAFESAVHMLVEEIEHADPELAARLRSPLEQLVEA